MPEVMLSIQKRNEHRFAAYLVERPNTEKQQTHGSVTGATQAEAANAAYRMAHQKGLKISRVFDEDAGIELFMHKLRFGQIINFSGGQGTIESFMGWENGEPRYQVRIGSDQCRILLEHEIEV